MHRKMKIETWYCYFWSGTYDFNASIVPFRRGYICYHVSSVIIDTLDHVHMRLCCYSILYFYESNFPSTFQAKTNLFCDNANNKVLNRRRIWFLIFWLQCIKHSIILVVILTHRDGFVTHFQDRFNLCKSFVNSLSAKQKLQQTTF